MVLETSVDQLVTVVCRHHSKNKEPEFVNHCSIGNEAMSIRN